jgi:hypothetical protein
MSHPAETPVGTGVMRVFGASFDYVAGTSRPIRGMVRDKDTGKPLAGVSVEFIYPTHERCKAVTDERGRYELLGVAKSEGSYTLEVKPADGRYLRRQVELHDTPGLDALPGDIGMVQGLMVRGKVTDRATGKPVAQARVDYHPLFGNSHVNAKIAGGWSPSAVATTGPDGSYALSVLPGPGLISVTAPQPDAYMRALVTPEECKAFFKTPIVHHRIRNSLGEDTLTIAGGGDSFRSLSPHYYHAVVLLEPDGKDQSVIKDVALERSLERKGRVVGPDGQPLQGVTALGLIPDSLGFFSPGGPLSRNGETLPGAEFTVRGIHPRAKRPLLLYHKDRNLGCVVNDVRGDASEPLTVMLQPCGSTSGRVMNQDGEPVVGLRLFVASRTFRWHGDMGRSVTTDKEGRFRAEGLVPGEEYWVSEPAAFPRVSAGVIVEPGKHKEMGDIKMTKPGE